MEVSNKEKLKIIEKMGSIETVNVVCPTLNIILIKFLNSNSYFFHPAHVLSLSLCLCGEKS